MYGFSGYGTNSYGSERQTSVFAPLAPVVKLAMRVLTLGFSQLALLLRFRTVTLSNPETNQTTLEL